jgi:hypothetical protein
MNAPGAVAAGEQFGDAGVRLTTTGFTPSVRIRNDCVLGETYLGVIRPAFAFGVIATAKVTFPSAAAAATAKQCGAKPDSKRAVDTPCEETHAYILSKRSEHAELRPTRPGGRILRLNFIGKMRKRADCSLPFDTGFFAIRSATRPGD